MTLVKIQYKITQNLKRSGKLVSIDIIIIKMQLKIKTTLHCF